MSKVSAAIISFYVKYLKGPPVIFSRAAFFLLLKLISMNS